MRRADPCSPQTLNRRQFANRSALAVGGLWAGGVAGSAQGAEPEKAKEAESEVRLALLMGNAHYPAPFDLPPIPKNVRDLRGALEKRGFSVSNALDTDLVASRRVLDSFIEQASKAPADATLFFYFSGHGVQVDAANLLLPAGLSPAAKGDVLSSSSLKLLTDVVARLPERKGGMTIAVVDACRTTLKAGDDGGLNQVQAPQGCLIAFSTGAGKPAVAPAVETQNTFYTGSLVKMLNSVSDDTLFPELFQLVKADVRNTMLKHPVEAIRRLAQDPFIADHTRARRALSPISKHPTTGARRFSDDTEGDDWNLLESTTWPNDVVKLTEAFLDKHKASTLLTSVQVARSGAQEAAKVLQRTDVKLYRSAFQLKPDMDADHRTDLHRAGRGDKDAAARLAQRHRPDRNVVGASSASASRYEGWLQMASALGNGIAAYDLALHYRREDQPLLASQYEARARELGYTPPPTLDNVRK